MASILEMIFGALQSHDIEVYPPATKDGECRTKYVVVKQDGSSQVGDFSSEYVFYQFMLYVPQNKYSELSQYEWEVKKVLGDELFPTLIPTGSNMPDYYDKDIKAHVRSFIYRNNVRNKHL